ncbi:MAG TPA: serine/threonine protein kinase, partial [Nannocystis exedens]|nr:serine/threonine protein kinase [Nannocystis exedens]
MKGSGQKSSFEATLAADLQALQATQMSLSPPAHSKREPDNSRPSRIGRYLIVDELGRGGMGVVYAAYDPELDRKVAIKLLLGEGRNPDAKARMLREAQSMARLSHAHVVHVHDVGTTQEGAIFIAMEYIQGQTLKEWLTASPRSPAEILAIFRQAGEGLAAAHAVELIHRDFKPDNVLLTAEGEAKISDFGLARPVELGTSEAPPAAPPLDPKSAATEDTPNENISTVLTQTGTILGTPAYMAPEQHLGEQADARSDQYSFCIALFEALYGHRPFNGKNIGELRLRVLGGLIEEPSPTAGVPRWIFPILARGLQVHPDDRWPTISDLLVALDNDPNRARRRWFYGMGLALLVSAGIFFAQHSQAAQVESAVAACTAPERALDDYWQLEGPKIRKAIVAVSTPGVSRMATLVDDGLTRFVGDWRHTLRQSCEAAIR